MKLSQFYGSRHLNAEDFSPEGENLTIAEIARGMVNTDDKGEEEKTVIMFNEREKPLVLNYTNATLLIDLFGDETDKMRGQVVNVYRGKTSLGKKLVDCVRIRERVS